MAARRKRTNTHTRMPPDVLVRMRCLQEVFVASAHAQGFDACHRPRMHEPKMLGLGCESSATVTRLNYSSRAGRRMLVLAYC